MKTNLESGAKTDNKLRSPCTHPGELFERNKRWILSSGEMLNKTWNHINKLGENKTKQTREQLDSIGFQIIQRGGTLRILIMVVMLSALSNNFLSNMLCPDAASLKKTMKIYESVCRRLLHG